MVEDPYILKLLLLQKAFELLASSFSPQAIGRHVRLRLSLED